MEIYLARIRQTSTKFAIVHTHPSTMTLVSNDPSVWPLINTSRVLSYFIAASCAAVAYDWALTFGQEVEMVWRQHWSLMTVLYIGLRYAGIPYAAVFMLINHSSQSVTDAVSNTMYNAITWMIFVANFLLGVIMIARLHAMYQQSRKMLIFLVVIFLAVTIVCIVVGMQANNRIIGEELILSGIHRCIYQWEGDAQLLDTVIWVMYTAWEVLALCLAVWVVVKHVRQLRRTTGWTIGDVFAMLLKTHVVYFISLVAANCLQLGFYSPMISGSVSLGSGIYDGILTFASVMQMFVLGPRLILSMRVYHAKLVADSDSATGMTSIAFQERIHVSTGGGVTV